MELPLALLDFQKAKAGDEYAIEFPVAEKLES